MITPIDLTEAGNPVIYRPFETEERVSAFRRLADAAKAHGSLVMMQLNHAGRQVAELINKNPVSASDVQLVPRMGLTFAKPKPYEG